MAKKNKYYVVWQGVEPGIYTTWSDCQLQIKGYPGAKYAGFPSQEIAQEAYEMGYDAYRAGKPAGSKKSGPFEKPNLPPSSWAVDAACSGNPGKMEYRGVWAEDGTEIFRVGPILYGTNNIGEFLALVHALALLDQKKKHEITIFSDSRIAMGWVQKGRCNTKLVRNQATRPLYLLIERAEKWLKHNTIVNPILKWETKKWGEIPADFGRK